MRKIIYTLALASLALFSAECASAQLRIPRGSAVSVDGKIETAEWSDAITRDLAGGGKLFLKHDGTSLLIGLRGKDKGWAQVYIGGDSPSNEFGVYHASAAVGKLVYRREGDLWQPIGKFNWQLRDRGFTREVESKLSDHMVKNN